MIGPSLPYTSLWLIDWLIDWLTSFWTIWDRGWGGGGALSTGGSKNRLLWSRRYNIMSLLPPPPPPMHEVYNEYGWLHKEKEHTWNGNFSWLLVSSTLHGEVIHLKWKNALVRHRVRDTHDTIDRWSNYYADNCDLWHFFCRKTVNQRTAAGV